MGCIFIRVTQWLLNGYTFSGFWVPKVTKMGSITYGHRIDNNGVAILRGQWLALATSCSKISKKLPQNFKKVAPKFLKSCPKLLEFYKKLLKTCSLSKIKKTGPTAILRFFKTNAASKVQ